MLFYSLKIKYFKYYLGHLRALSGLVVKIWIL